MQFSPPIGLRNKHVQTILSSVGPRHKAVSKRFSRYLDTTKTIILDCDDNVRLQGFYNQSDDSNRSSKLVILIHGWEGSANSSYMLSMTSSLLEAGVDVFRLNMRDHGDTHRLNSGIFNSTLINEVVSAVEKIQQQFPHQLNYLGGFSLGGNFSLRVAAHAHQKSISLQKVFAFCPVVHARSSNMALNQARNWLYAHYFVRKWKKSLYKKLIAFPDLGYGQALKKMKTLTQMNQQLIPKYAGFEDVDVYFDAYAIHADRLQNVICPCYLHFAEDDMIIPISDVALINENPNVHISTSRYGGHCGFLMNWQGRSWQDQRVIKLIAHD
jgi:predicted alpha/beta-fold hydrolase